MGVEADARTVMQYKGAGGERDEYFLGFFAGITVEADHVTIDLNGHGVAQSRALYLQQRFFCASRSSRWCTR